MSPLRPDVKEILRELAALEAERRRLLRRLRNIQEDCLHKFPPGGFTCERCGFDRE